MNHTDLKSRRSAAIASPTNLGRDATRDISAALNLLLADVFALYLKTKNFHWHVSGPHFRGCGAVADRCLTGNDDVVRKPCGIAPASRYGSFGRNRRPEHSFCRGDREGIGRRQRSHSGSHLRPSSELVPSSSRYLA